MATAKALSLWQNLRSEVTGFLKDRGGKDDKKVEATEKINYKGTTNVAKILIKRKRNKIVYISSKMITIRSSDGGADVRGRVEWVNKCTSFHNKGESLVLVSGHITKTRRRKIALLETAKPYSIQYLPDVPETIVSPGVIRADTHIYLIGGYRYTKYTARQSSTVHRLCLETKQWETCPSVPSAVTKPISFQHQQYIYIFGSQFGSLMLLNASKKSYRFCIETSKWSSLKDLPSGVNSDTGTAKFFKGRIIIATRKRIMQYDLATDEWTVEVIKDLKKRPLLVIIEGKLCAFVRNDEVFARMVYDEQQNVWLQWEPTSD